MTDQKKAGCCGQQANTQTEAAVAGKQGCGCDNEARGKEQSAVAAVQPQETNKSKQSRCCC